MTPLAGFAPDADATTPGVITDCTNFVPNQTGMESGPDAITPGDVPVLAAACQGAAVVYKLDDSRRVVAGTQTKLYELVAGSWTDRSRVGNYTGSADGVWSIAQFGDATLASNRNDTIQRSTTGAFADIATAPKAKIIFSVGPQVMALNVNDGAEKPDGWHCCGLYDETTWTASLTTQAANGRLVSSAGAITAGARLGEYAIAYKSRSIYMGQYVGAPVVWQWIQVPGGDAGCVGQNALCDLGGVHFFVGESNFWLFDGTRPTPIADNVLRQWFYDNSSKTYLYKTTCVFDRQNNRVWVFYVSKNGSTLDSALVYHVLSKKWGRADRSIECALNYVSSGITYDTLSGTYDTLPDVSYDSQYWLAGGKALSVVNTSHQLQMLTGASTSSSFTTGAVGDDDAVSLLSRIRLRYAVAPSSAQVTTSTSMTSGSSFATGVTNAGMNDGKFDVMQSARWHKARFDFTGAVQVTAMDAQARATGTR